MSNRCCAFAVPAAPVSDPPAADADVLVDLRLFPARTTERLVQLAERLARTVARRWRYADVDELVQVGLAAALERVRAYRAREGTSLEAFVSRRMRGAMNDHCERERRSAVRHVELPEEDGVAEDGREEDADEDELWVALSKLEEPRRSVIVAHVVDGLPLTECARRLGIAYHRARYALEAGLAELRGELVESGRGDRGRPGRVRRTLRP